MSRDVVVSERGVLGRPNDRVVDDEQGAEGVLPFAAADSARSIACRTEDSSVVMAGVRPPVPKRFPSGNGVDRYVQEKPPSTTSAWPVIQSASSLAKNNIAFAISSGSPRRFSG